MKLYYRIRMALFSVMEQLKISLLILVICFLSFYMLGNTLNEYFSRTAWNGKAVRLLGTAGEDLYYLDYSKFTGGVVLDSSVYEEMFQKIRNLDGISWFGAYQTSVYRFDENRVNGEYQANEDYLAFIRKTYPDFYERFDSGSTPAVYLYGDGWELGDLETVQGEPLKGTLESGEIPLYVGAELEEYFQVGNVYHQDGGTFRVVGILKPGSRFLLSGGLWGVMGMIDLDRYVVSGIHDNLFSGSGLYINFSKNVYIRFTEGSDREETVRQILDILDEYGYHGWCKPVEDMEREREEANQTEMKEKLDLLVLLLLLDLSIMIVVGGIRIMSRKKTYGIWYANGFSTGDIISCLFLEQSVLVLAAFFLSAGILAGEVGRYLKEVNQPMEVYSLMDRCFISQTLPVLFVFAVISIAVPIAISVFLFRRFHIVDMLKDTEKE